ncbi:actin cytoskeleton-regulatory complex protein PAN1-like isoform X3 [Phyllostomus hastatus]|uniref:actin cytoskeleton-regulatory complex protein PAN1-like isoform X3 n=1 Tax=Phyllostomus hastatus TaxID=9423 RepID=UPI001E684917|nr:actin cytoskeleton-regulatory complex protein PAN1-like isoform X3 [Phyllostomus hastatus]
MLVVEGTSTPANGAPAWMPLTGQNSASRSAVRPAPPLWLQGAVIGASATRAPGPHLPACPHKEAGSGYAVPRHAAPGLSVPAPRTQDCLSPSLPFPLRTPQAWERASGAAAECHLGVAQGGITVLRANTRHRRLCSGPPPGVAPPPPQPPHCCCGVPPPPLLLPPCGHQSER